MINDNARDKYLVIFILLLPELPPSILNPPKIDILNNLT